MTVGSFIKFLNLRIKGPVRSEVKLVNPRFLVVLTRRTQTDGLIKAPLICSSDKRYLGANTINSVFLWLS